MSDDQVGYLHRRDVSTRVDIPVKPEEPRPIIDVKSKLEAWYGTGRGMRLDQLACNLAVTVRSLEMLECTKSPYYETWAFPMRSGTNRYVGIRLRKLNGDKWAERGSHQGLFIPQTEPDKLALITEGPTDTAAALSLGYFAIGRPNCCGGIEFIKSAIQHFKIKRVVIVSDLDDAGLRGATTLAEHLPIPSAILVCPAKDLRQAVANGMDKPMCEAMIRQLVWSKA